MCNYILYINIYIINLFVITKVDKQKDLRILLKICFEDDENPEYDVESEEVFPLNPDSADLCAIARTKSPKISQGENMPPGGIIVITGGRLQQWYVTIPSLDY